MLNPFVAPVLFLQSTNLEKYLIALPAFILHVEPIPHENLGTKRVQDI